MTHTQTRHTLTTGTFSVTNAYHARRARVNPTRQLRHPVVPFSFGRPKDGVLNDTTKIIDDVYGPTIYEHLPVVPSKTLASLSAAIDKRCNYFTSERVHSSIRLANADLLDEICPQPLEPIEWSIELFEKWNQQFEPAKQAKQAKAIRYGQVAEMTSKQFSDKQIFVKMEALLKRHDHNWAPRIIYQSSDIHNAVLGPIMQECTRRMFKCFDQRRGPDTLEVMGAYKKTSEEIVDHFQRSGDCNSRFISTDFSANDSSQVLDVHMLEVSWLRRLGAPMWLTSLMLVANSYTASNYTYAMKVRIKNQLPTGSQSTTFRNSMWNATILKAFTIHVGRVGAAAILGDDCVIRLDRATRPIRFYVRQYEFIAKLAHMKVKCTVSKTLQGVSFLSRWFTQLANGTYVMVPFLGKAVARFNVCPNPKQDPSAYICGKALSYSYEFRHFPAIKKLFLAKFAQLYEDGMLDLGGVSWNLRGLFIRLGLEGILQEIKKPSSVGFLYDFTPLVHSKFGITASEYYQAVFSILFGKEDISMDGLGFLDLEWL